MLNNTIAFNRGTGVAVVTGSGNTIQENSIHDNAALGIDLGDDGVTANHVGFEAGPNNYQNYPVLSGVQGGTTRHQAGLEENPLANGMTFGLVGVEHVVGGAAKDCVEFPRKVGGILDSGVHALPAHR